MEEGGHPSEKHMDDFFKSIGLQRKKIAKDGSCLFRAVAEQVLLCQSLHTQVRARCVEFLKDNRELYKEFIEGDFDDYLCKIQDPQDWVGEVEINALANIYKRDFLIFQEPGKPAVNITANGFKHQVQLCFLNGNHYDSVYPVSHIQNTALCQSLLYELLYEGVFGEDHAVLGSGLRGGRSSELTDDHMTACPSSDESETEDPKWIDNGAPKLGGQQNRGRGRGWRGRGRGLSERLRRSLNPNLLRNVDYDVWLTSKRVQQKMDFCMAAGMQYSKGDRCQVCLDGSGRSYSGSISKVSPSNGPVSVFVDDLGKLVSVPLLNLRPVSDSSWTTVVSGEKRTNGHTTEWVEPKGRGRGKPLPSASLPSFAKAAQRGSPGHVQKQTSWPPNITVDTQVQRGSRGRSATCEDVQMTSENSREEEEEEAELRAALVEIQLRDEQNFPALAAVPRGGGGKRRGGDGMSKVKSGGTTGQADAPLPGTAASTSPSSSPPTHPEHPGPAPTTWLASLKAPLLSQNTTFTSAPRPPGTVAPPTTTTSAAPTTTAPTTEQSLPSSSSPSSSSAPIFIAPVAPPPGGTHFHLPRTSPAPSASGSAPPARSSPSGPSPVSSPLLERPAPDVMNTARHMQLPAAYVANTPVPQNLIPSNPVPQTSLPQNPTPPPSVPQNPLLQSSVPQNLLHSNTIPQHPAPEPSMPQHPVPEPSVPQHPEPQPSTPQHPVPQYPVPEPPVPQHPVAQPIIPHQPTPEPSVHQYPVAQSSVPQHPVAQPSVPQHPVAQPPVPQHPVAQPSVPQDPVPEPSVPQYPVAQSTVTQHPITQPPVPQHPVPEPFVPQYPETQTPVPQHPVPEPPVPQHPVAQPSVLQQSLPQYPQLQASSPVPGLLSASRASAESPPNPSSHPLAPSLPPNPLPPQQTFNPSSRPEPSQAAVPLQQLSQLYQDPLYPGFPMGPTGDVLPTPAYSSSRTGDDLPRDMNVLRWFFNLGVKGYCNPLFPPYMYLLPLQQSHTMHPPPCDPTPQGQLPTPQGQLPSPQGQLPSPQGLHPSPQGQLPSPQGQHPTPQGLHPSPPLLWQHTAPPPPGHPLGYPSTGPGPRYPSTPSPGLQLYPSDRLRPPPDASPGPSPRQPKLEVYGGGAANRAHAAPDAMLANVGVGKPAAGVLVDPGHRHRQVLLIDPPLNNMPIWVAEPKCQDSVTAATHGNCGARSLYSPVGNAASSEPHGVHYLGYPAYNNQIVNPPEGYVHMGAGPGMEPWKGPEFGPSNQRSRRGYQHQRGGGGEQRGRGYRRGSRPQYNPHSVGHRTRDQVYY